MEIASLSPSTIRIKGKTITFIVDPATTRAKLVGDATMLLGKASEEVAVEGSRLTMAGPGEYEIGGVKITGVRVGEGVSYYLSLDGISLLVAQVGGLKGKESLRDVDIAILFSNAPVDPSALASVTSGVAVLYGPQAAENMKVLGKEGSALDKYTVTKDKLPSEMEVVLLA